MMNVQAALPESTRDQSDDHVVDFCILAWGRHQSV